MNNNASPDSLPDKAGSSELIGEMAAMVKLGHKDPMSFARLRGMGALADRMGIEMLEFGLDKAVARMPVAGNTQPIMLLHGGAYVVLGETLGSLAANLFCMPERYAVGLDINATHLRSATSGYIYGHCTPLHLGGKMTSHEIVILNEEGKRCSIVRITNMLLERKPD